MSDWNETNEANRQDDNSESHPSDLTSRGRGAIRGEVESFKQEARAPSDARQISDAIARLKQIPEVRPESWQALDPHERFQTMGVVETMMADVQGRPARELVSEETSRGEFGYFNGEKIHVSNDELERGSAWENVDTIIHEGRHAYQRYAIDNPDFHPDSRQVEAWRQNFTDYKDPQYDIEAYRKQPLEADAWSYAAAVVSGLRAGSLEEEQS